MLVTNIELDTDGEVVDLPNEVEVPDEYDADYDGIADYLSDKYGFCVENYSLYINDKFGTFLSKVEKV